MSRKLTNTTVRVGYYNGDRYDHQLGLDNASRTTAFAKIYAKSEAPKAKAKTQMCRSIVQGGGCRFGDRCTYAHAESELVKQECAFGDTCRTMNSKTNPCKFSHTKSFVPAPAKKVDLVDEVKAREERLAAEKAAAIAKAKQEAEEVKRSQLVITLDDSDDENEISDGEEGDTQLAISEEEDEETKAMLRLAEEDPAYAEPSQQFQGWKCDSMGPVDTSEGWIGQQPYQQIIERQQLIIQQQQEHIDALVQHLHIPCVPVYITPFQAAQCFGVPSC